MPDNESHAKGYRGELNLANRIAMRMAGERVIRYGNKAGANGPDIISVSSNGDITVWDSKWRSAERAMTEAGRGHTGQDALVALQLQILDAIKAAKSRLHPAAYEKALANAQNGNFFIVTAGTGKAYNAVIEEVRGLNRVARRRANEPDAVTKGGGVTREE